MPTDPQAAATRGEPGQAFTHADTLFVTALHNLPGVSDDEEVDYYTPGDRERLQRDLLSKAEHYFALFSGSYEYEDYFSCADYGVPEDWLAGAELETFRSVLDLSERDCPPSDLHPRSILEGFRAVVDSRIRANDVAGGIELFNFVMVSALATNDNRNPRCYITLCTAKEFAPTFLDNLLDAVREREENRSRLPRRRYLGEALKPLQRLLTMSRRVVSGETWPQDDIVLGKFLLLVDYFRELTRGWRGEAED